MEKKSEYILFRMSIILWAFCFTCVHDIYIHTCTESQCQNTFQSVGVGQKSRKSIGLGKHKSVTVLIWGWILAYYNFQSFFSYPSAVETANAWFLYLSPPGFTFRRHLTYLVPAFLCLWELSSWDSGLGPPEGQDTSAWKLMLGIRFERWWKLVDIFPTSYPSVEHF